MSLEFKSPFAPCVPVAADTLVTPEVWSTDKNANGQYLLGMGGVSYPKSKTLYVDPVKGFDTGRYAGVRGTSLPFRSLAGAVAAMQDGDAIECAPGSAFAVSVGMTLSRNDITIKFNGSVITTSADLYHVFNITGARVTLCDMKITGNSAPVLGEYANGLIRVAGSNCTLRKLHFHDSTQNGIEPVAALCSGLHVDQCLFERVKLGIYSTGTLTVDTENILIFGSVFEDCADRAIRFSGQGLLEDPSTRKWWKGIQLIGNRITASEQRATAGIEIWGGCSDVTEQGNYVYNYQYGISNDRCVDVNTVGNNIKACLFIGIESAGCQRVNYTGNSIDGSDYDGSMIGGQGISVSNFLDTNYDAGEIVISSNIITNCGNGGYNSVDIQAATIVSLIGNTIRTSGAGARFLATDFITALGNSIDCTGDSNIQLDFANRAAHSAIILSNTFRGATNHAIHILGAGNVSDGIRVVGNHTPANNTYLNDGGSLAGIVRMDGGTPPLILSANFPKSNDVTRGWSDIGSSDVMHRSEMSFTPTATGWYRILTGTSGEFFGDVHITDWTSTTQTDWNLSFSVGAYGGGLVVNQINGLASNYAPPSISKVRAGKNASQTVLDVYVNTIPNGPITFYFNSTDEGRHEGMVMDAIDPDPERNPSTGGWTFSELILAFNCFNTSTGYAVNGIVVLGSQQAAIADSTATAGSVSTQLNLVLAALRAHGIIAP